MQISTDRILVVGDAMLDMHLFGHSDRISPEAPVPVITMDQENISLGGASNVAAHITSSCIRTTFAYKSCNGVDHMSLASACSTRGMLPHPLIYPKQIPVTTKKRIWSGKQQVCRVDCENNDSLPLEVALQWMKEIIRITERDNVKIIILSDYDKGTLSDEFIQYIASYGQECGIKVILDPKRPTFYKIKNLFAVKPNNKELSATNLTAIECSKQMGDTYLIHTKGKDGMSIFQNGSLIFECPTVAKEVFDVTGCGDSVSAILGISLYHDMPIQKAVVAANKAASYTITHIGCYVLDSKEIQECLEFANGTTCNS